MLCVLCYSIVVGAFVRYGIRWFVHSFFPITIDRKQGREWKLRDSEVRWLYFLEMRRGSDTEGKVFQWDLSNGIRFVEMNARLGKCYELSMKAVDERFGSSTSLNTSWILWAYYFPRISITDPLVGIALSLFCEVACRWKNDATYSLRIGIMKLTMVPHRWQCVLSRMLCSAPLWLL